MWLEEALCSEPAEATAVAVWNRRRVEAAQKTKRLAK